MHRLVVTHHPLRAVALVVALLTGVGLLAACGSGSGSGSGNAESGRTVAVTGAVVQSAACPVAQAERSCPTRPVAGAQVALWRDGRQVAATKTDEQGRFRLSGQEGDAEIRARTAPGGYVARTSQAVTLVLGTPTHVRLLLDNGIR